jgi:phospholipid/cholesterol/gamma-HCH transport system substrate-binding protein
MQHNLVETLVGAFVIAVSAIFLSYGYSVSDMSPKSGYKLIAEFDRIDGLTVGSDVRMSGIKVGTVIDQELNKQNFYATVTLSINDDIELPDDTSAKITMEGLLGGNYVSLTPGGGFDLLTDGDEISYTQGSIDLIGLVSQAMFSTQNEDSE